jgi:hypothetical protein
MDTVRSIRLAVVVALTLVALGCLPETVRRTDPPAIGPATPSAAPTPSGPTPVPSFVRPTPTPMPTFLSYTVVAGDSLTSIARRFRTTGRSIAFWNRATYPSLDPDSTTYSPNLIRLGWKLVLIPGVVADELALPSPSSIPTPTPEAAVSSEPSP